ncbi:CDP-alcohol phosphatidyltransferase family protein [Balneolaceae bacterium ANBcel3]|nr:CDP-alcohol phosphatidyltransferase family protein [Balneolaceae bacterium ANBcel3]
MTETNNLDGKIIPVKNDVLTFANAISLSRALIAIPILILHQLSGEEANWIIIAFIFYAFISDYLDGYFARKFNQVTEFGKIVDPLADKVCAIILFLYAVYIDIIPAFFVIILISRDVLILIGSLLIKKKRGKYAMSALPGKITVNVLAIYWIVAFFFPGCERFILVLMYLSLLLLFYSLAVYVHRYFMIQKKGADFN